MNNPLLQNNPWIHPTSDGKYIVTGPTNSPALPEIYQIEIAERCNFSCDFCVTGKQFQGKSKKNPFVDINLIKTIIERDIGGSYFIELQHRGEPLLNNQLGDIIELLRPYVFVGLSTNGSLIHKKIEELLQLDYITVSVDAADKQTYEQLRIGGNWEVLINNIDLLIKARGANPTPVIDLQLIQLHEIECKKDELQQICTNKNWDVRIRTIQDCFLGSTNQPELYKVQSDDLCLNPFMSVSIHANGNVTPCCRSWESEWDYGNLYEKSLSEIWNNNPKVDEFRWLHRKNSTALPYMCQTCYSRSSTTLHWDLYKNAVQNIMHRNGIEERFQLKIKSAQGD